jgi:hypothetical protein
MNFSNALSSRRWGSLDIASQTVSPQHPDYPLECQVALDIPVQNLFERAVQAGWRAAADISVLEEVTKSKALAYNQDPDTEDDNSEIGLDPTTPALSGFR